MKTNNDIKVLWNQQEVASIPEIKEVSKKATRIKRGQRNKLLLVNLLLAVIVAYLMINTINSSEMITSKIGVLMAILAISFYLSFSNSILPLFFKRNITSNNAEYLNNLIQIKQKQTYLHKTLTPIYFILLSVGVLLYQIEATQKMELMHTVLTYSLTIAWILFAWFYIRPKAAKRQLGELDEIINKYQDINKQLSAND